MQGAGCKAQSGGKAKARRCHGALLPVHCAVLLLGHHLPAATFRALLWRHEWQMSARQRRGGCLDLTARDTEHETVQPMMQQLTGVLGTGTLGGYRAAGACRAESTTRGHFMIHMALVKT